MYFNIVPDCTEKFPQCNRHSFHKIDALAIQACSLTQSYNRFCKYCQRCGKACLKNNKSCANGNQGSILQTLAVSPVKRCRQSINFRKPASRRYASDRSATPRSDNKSHHDNNPHRTAQHAGEAISYSILWHSREVFLYKFNKVIDQPTGSVSVIQYSWCCLSHRLAIASVSSTLSWSVTAIFCKNGSISSLLFLALSGYSTVPSSR